VVHRRKLNPYFKRGTAFRSAVDVLRRAGRPMTGREIIREMLVTKGVQNVTSEGVGALWLALQSSFNNHEGKSVERLPGVIPAQWRLIER
jgi:hypothetical protein